MKAIMNNYTLNIKNGTAAYEKAWEMCVGSCHATTALREDYRSQLIRCKNETGFKYVRFHGLFDDDMSVLTYQPMRGGQVTSYTNTDSIFDFLLSIGMKPFVELGFMPECLKSKDTTVFHYKGNTSPPADYDAWGAFIEDFVRHNVQRYGLDEVRQWFFEVWNEPNLGGPDSPFGFWSGTKEEYFKLYKVTAEAVKKVDSRLKVGGPATSNNAWVKDTVEFCAKENVPLDFISTHHYPTDVVLGFGVEDSANFAPPIDLSSPEDIAALMTDKDKVAEILASYSVFKDGLWEHVDRGVVTEMAKQAREEAGGLPLYYTEWNSLAGLPSDGPFGSSFIAKTVLDNIGIVDGYSYWTFSDLFEESGMPSAEFHGGFGLLTLHGVPKASYRAFQLLHKLGNRRYDEVYSKGTVDIYAFQKPESNAVQLMLINHHSLMHDIESEKAVIKLTGLEAKAGGIRYDIERVDDSNANAIACWEKQGKPEYASAAQIYEMMAASELFREEKVQEIKGGELEIEIELPPMGMALVTVYL